jgi:hypothetical protein
MVGFNATLYTGFKLQLLLNGRESGRNIIDRGGIASHGKHPLDLHTLKHKVIYKPRLLGGAKLQCRQPDHNLFSGNTMPRNWLPLPAYIALFRWRRDT